MKKTIAMCGLFIFTQIFGLDAAASEEKHPKKLHTKKHHNKKHHKSSSSSSHSCKRKGDTGSRGERGPLGSSGSPFEIKDVIKVTSQVAGTVGSTFIPFSNPISYPTNGIDQPASGGMTLVESVPTSGKFDTIILPLENADTFYLVTYGISTASPDPTMDFQLVLNGTILPYTTLGVDVYSAQALSRTSIIMNPANVEGRLSFLAVTPNAAIEPATPGSFSAFLNIVKLNNNAT